MNFIKLKQDAKKKENDSNKMENIFENKKNLKINNDINSKKQMNVEFNNQMIDNSNTNTRNNFSNINQIDIVPQKNYIEYNDKKLSIKTIEKNNEPLLNSSNLTVEMQAKEKFRIIKENMNNNNFNSSLENKVKETLKIIKEDIKNSNNMPNNEILSNNSSQNLVFKQNQSNKRKS